MKPTNLCPLAELWLMVREKYSDYTCSPWRQEMEGANEWSQYSTRHTCCEIVTPVRCWQFTETKLRVMSFKRMAGKTGRPKQTMILQQFNLSKISSTWFRKWLVLFGKVTAERETSHPPTVTPPKLWEKWLWWKVWGCLTVVKRGQDQRRSRPETRPHNDGCCCCTVRERAHTSKGRQCL